LNGAIAADPAFGLAYIVLAESAGRGTPQNTSDLLSRAEAHEALFTPLDRARFAALQARLSHAPLSRQQTAFQNLVQITPNSVDALAALGSIRFLEGDGVAGQQSLSRALELSPGNLSLRQQLAQGLFQTRQFAAAEKLFDTLDNNPAVLPALATCVLLEGDTARANTIVGRFFASVANPDVKNILQGTWLAISKSIPDAIHSIETSTFVSPQAKAAGLSQIAVWQLLSGSPIDAKKSAAEARQLDARLVSFGAAAVLLTDGDGSVDDWRNEVNASAFAADAQAKQLLLGYGFFLNRRYAEAALVWKEILDSSGGADLHARTMLASSLAQTGNTAARAAIVVEPFVPDFGDLYAAISFNQMKRLLEMH